MNDRDPQNVLMRAARRLADLGFIRAAIEHRRLRRQAAEWTPRHERMQNFYARFASPGDLCFDVGANLGDRSRVFRALDARVVAVEPQPACARALRAAYRRDTGVIIEECALSDAPGLADLYIGNAHVLSTLSKDWIAANQRSGRLASSHWDDQIVVEVRTFDQLIRQYGTPAFSKIDVEGSEASVFRGLSVPLKFLSFEFTAEYLQAALDSLDRLSQIGFTAVNYSFGESLELELPGWVPCAELRRILPERASSGNGIGDLYLTSPLSGPTLE